MHWKPHRRATALLTMLAVALLATTLIPRGASAHVHQSVLPYEFTVGWIGEPAVVGVLNGLDLGIERNVSGTLVPAKNAVGNITAQYVFGSAKYSQDIAPQDGRPGWYTFPIIPTKSGSYSVHISGTLNGTAVNFTVTPEPVEAAAGISFPAAQPTPDSLAQTDQEQGQRLNQTLAALGLAQGLAITGVSVGAVGIILAVFSLVRSSRSPRG